MKAFIVSPEYESFEDKTLVKLYGKLENGQSFVSVNTIIPYFYIKSSDLKKINRFLKKYKTEETKLTTFSGEKVTKISHPSQTQLNNLHEAIKKSVDTYEADIKPHFRFMYDLGLLGTIDIEGSYEPSEKIDRVYQEPKISPSYYKPE